MGNMTNDLHERMSRIEEPEEIRDPLPGPELLSTIPIVAPKGAMSLEEECRKWLGQITPLALPIKEEIERKTERKK